MIKTYKAILSVLLVVLCVFAVVTVTGVLDINKIVTEKLEQTTSPEGEKIRTYADDFNQYTKAGLPLMKTDFDNIFYTIDTSGNVEFFKAEGKNIEKTEESGSFEVTVSCSGQDIPATIHYIEKDEKICGYGLFTNVDYPEVFLYEYAFFKVTEQFEGWQSVSDLLLLVDVEKDRIYDENKVYSESFYLYEDYDSDVFLNEDQRIPDLKARLRTDYKMFTDNLLHQDDKELLFFSSRSYNDYEYSSLVDIYMTGGYGENVDNNRYIKDVASLDLWRTQEGTVYFSKKTTENEAGETVTNGFAVSVYDGENTVEKKAFEGSLEKDYLLSGQWLLNKASGEIYNVVTGETRSLDYTKFATAFTPDLFDMSENGKYCLVRGANNLGKPSLGFMDFENGEFSTYTDNVFGYVVSLQALDDSTAVVNIANGEQASSYYQLVGPIGAMSAEQESLG